MRPGPNKRSRGRNNGNNPHHRPRMPHRIQTFDSNGPNVKIRGNAYQVFERYVALAREAAASGALFPRYECQRRSQFTRGSATADNPGRPRADGYRGRTPRNRRKFAASLAPLLTGRSATRVLKQPRPSSDERLGGPGFHEFAAATHPS